MHCIARNSICRGMESHIVRRCRETCRDHRTDVLRAQAQAKWNMEANIDEGLEEICKVSCRGSLGSKFLALKLAQQDSSVALGEQWDSSLLPLDLI